MPRTNSPDLEVAVVGAGAAGIACGERLAEAGLKFRLLEARDRVGGRVHTDYRLAAGWPLELGAQMIHGRHVVTQRWARESGLEVRRLRVTEHSRMVLDGRIARFPWLALPFHPVFGTRAVYEGLLRIPRAMARYSGPDLSVRDFLARVHSAPAPRLLVELLHCHTYATDSDQVGVLGTSSEDRLSAESFGFRNFQVMRGYSELIQRRARPLAASISLNSPVALIRVVPEGVRLSIAPRQGEPASELSAKRAVVTVPLGVLKGGGIEFDPPLPEAKRRAIETINFGQAYTVQLRLRTRSIRDRLGDFSMIWGGTASTFHRPMVGLNSGIEYVGAFTVGKEAVRRATLSDPELVATTMDELRQILPGPPIVDEVVDHAVHRWSMDPFSQGAYSVLGPGASLSLREALAAPVDERLFFAGEATHHRGESATVHGAIETGYRAAREVIESLADRHSAR